MVVFRQVQVQRGGYGGEEQEGVERRRAEGRAWHCGDGWTEGRGWEGASREGAGIYMGGGMQG